MHSTFFNRLSNRGQHTAAGGAWTTGYNYDYVRTWTRRVDLFSKQLIIFPINIDNVHWCLAVARIGAARNLGNSGRSGSLDGREGEASAKRVAAVNNGALLYFDSNRSGAGVTRLGQSGSPRFATEVLTILQQYFADEWADKHPMAPSLKPWRLKPLGTGTRPGLLPQQHDSSSCGVFMCAFAEALTRGVQPDELGSAFSSDDADEFRALMAADMMRGVVG
jgi:sentrin-specific protease 1